MKVAEYDSPHVTFMLWSITDEKGKWFYYAYMTQEEAKEAFENAGRFADEQSGKTNVSYDCPKVVAYFSTKHPKLIAKGYNVASDKAISPSSGE